MATLFTQAPGVVSSRVVSTYEFSPTAVRIDFRLRCDAVRLACPVGRAAERPLHDYDARSWRHLNFFQYQAFYTVNTFVERLGRRLVSFAPGSARFQALIRRTTPSATPAVFPPRSIPGERP